MDTAIAEKLIESQRAENGRSRDQELVRYVGRHGVVTMAQVMKAMGVGRTAAYRRVAACCEAGLLERLDLLRSEPSVLRATREGLRYGGLGLSFAVVSPSSVIHSIRCASAAQFLGGRFGYDRILTEREISFAERIEERPIASAEVGHLPSGKPRMHRADLAVLAESGTIAIEVELTPKSPRRLEGIIRAWRRAGCVEEVHYLCAPGSTHRTVERAVKATGAGSKVAVIEGVPA
jgi:hypothetical protein